MIEQHEIQIRVRYQETDVQGRVHHANDFTYFEQGRVELLRAAGFDYRRLEAAGTLLVVAEIACQYYLPASYDDLLTLRTTTVSAKALGWSTATRCFATANCWPKAEASWLASTGREKSRGCRNFCWPTPRISRLEAPVGSRDRPELPARRLASWPNFVPNLVAISRALDQDQERRSYGHQRQVLKTRQEQELEASGVKASGFQASGR